MTDELAVLDCHPANSLCSLNEELRYSRSLSTLIARACKVRHLAFASADNGPITAFIGHEGHRRRTMKSARIRSTQFFSWLGIQDLALVGLLALVCLTPGCGGGGPQSAVVVVMVNPPAVMVPLGASQTFMAAVTVTGTASTAVSWTIQEGAAGGSIDNQGNYIAPQVAGTYHVIATCVADPTKSATATITVPVAVTVSPNPATVFLGAMQNFTAAVAGSTNMAVTWAVQEGAVGGSIDNQGNYTAPQVAGTYHVIATSVADKTQSGTATITVPAVSVTVSPNLATVFLGGMQTFTAAVTATNMAVTWSIQEGAAGGSIDNQGNYTAPQVVGTYHVVATSVADKTQSGTATITVPAVSVTVSPNPATVFLGAMQTFTAAVSATNMAVTWSIQEGAAGGSIDNQGNYTAPQVVGTYHVVATSVADPTKSGTATITVPPVTVTVFPTTDSLGPNGLRTFLATVTGAINTAVTWTITEGAAGGTIDVNGKYVAPLGQGTFHIVATSVADTTKNATATVTVVPSGFLPTGSMTTPRALHTATLLNTGEALVAGGIVGYRFVSRLPFGGFCSPIATAKADLFDSTTGTFAATGAMTTARYAHTATVLQDGNKVLVAGGSTVSPPTAEIFDPATATFTATGNMLAARQRHTATLLASGKVLVTGGQGGLASAELFDPTMGAFAATGSMTDTRYSHTATLLQTDKVLVVGGVGASGAVSTAELYDPVAGTFSATGSMTTARRNHTATLLPSNGKVLIAGGTDQTGQLLTSAEIYDPVTGVFTPTGSMGAAHSGHTATLLPNGKVLVAGGGNFVAELFDPGTGTFSQTGSMLLSRTSHAATLPLPSGEVVVTGSATPVTISRISCSGGAIASAELYH